MPRNGSGAYSVPNSFSAGQSISSAAMNANFSDVGTELANSLPRDGQAAMTGQLKAANGSAAAPSITFGSDTNSGLFRKTADTIGVAVGGVEVGTLTASGLTALLKASSGSIGAPGISFSADTDSGLYRKSADVVGLVAGGVEVGTLTSSGQTVDLADGAAGTPSLSFQSDSNTGFFRKGADAIGVAANGAEVASFASSGVTGAVKATAGNAAGPGLSFSTDTNTGFFAKSADVIGVSVGGSEVGTISSAGLGGTINPIPSGTVMLFVQTAAPTGWVKSTTHNNKALRVVSGNASSGGSTAFTSVFTSRTLTTANLPAHTHGPGTLAGTTNTTGSHSHEGTRRGGTFGPTQGGATYAPTSNTTTGAAGDHSHTVTIGSGVTGSAGSGTPLDFAVAYVDVILATKS